MPLTALLLTGCGAPPPPPPPPSTPVLVPPKEEPSQVESPSTSPGPADPKPGDDEGASAEAKLVALPPDGGELYNPVWSPSGEELVFSSFVDDQDNERAHSSVHLYSVAESKLTTLLSRTAQKKVFYRFERTAWRPLPNADRLSVTELTGPYASEGLVIGWVVPSSGGKAKELPGDTEASAWSVDGKKLARLRLDEAREQPSHYVDWLPADFTSAKDSVIAVPPGSFEFIDDLAWSRTKADEILLVGSTQAMPVLAAAPVGSKPGGVRTIAKLGQNFGFGSALVWHPDGAEVLLADGTELLRINVKSGALQRQSYPGEIVGYSPDGEVVAFLVDDRLNVVVRGDERPQSLLEIEDVEDTPVETAFAPDLSKLAICADGKLWLYRFAQG